MRLHVTDIYSRLEALAGAAYRHGVHMRVLAGLPDMSALGIPEHMLRLCEDNTASYAAARAQESFIHTARQRSVVGLMRSLGIDVDRPLELDDQARAELEEMRRRCP